MANQDNNQEENNQIPPDEYERELTTDLDDETPDPPKGMPLHTKILIGLAVGVIAGLIVNWTLVEPKETITTRADGTQVIRTITETPSGIEVITVKEKAPDTVENGTVTAPGAERVIERSERRGVSWIVANFTKPIGQLFLNLLLMIVVPLVFASLVVGVAGIGDISKLGRIGAKSFVYTLIISAISVVIGLGLANLISPGTKISDPVKEELSTRFGSDASSRVSSAINIGPVSAAYAKTAEAAAGKFGELAAEAETDREAANEFAGKVAAFAKTSEIFAEDIKKSYTPVEAYADEVAAITKAADTMAKRTDLLAVEAAKFSNETKNFLSSVKSARSSAETPLMSVVNTIVPSNVFYSIAGQSPNMLHIMFFALIVGIAITLIPAAVTDPFVGFMDAVFKITAKIIDIVMKFAPYAVACLLFNNIALFGLDLLQSLAWFVFTVLLGLSIHFFGTYSLSVYFLSGMNPLEFFRRLWTVILTAFSTSSSNATLPTALRVSEENLGVPKHINSFVLTVGATANQNGTALYEGVTVLFLAQLAGIELTLGIQLMIVYLAILGGIGTAGVPSGSIPFIIGILAMIGVNPALIAIIIGVDRILDMCRTTLNVVGDVTAATYVAKSEGYELLKNVKPSELV
jgi:Na+/H+-dicarboxylate symporter